MLQMNLQFFGGRGSSGGNKVSGSKEASQQETSPNAVGYDIYEEAKRKGWDSPREMIMNELNANHSWFENNSEMTKFVENLGYSVVTKPVKNYFTVVDNNDNTKTEFVVYFRKSKSQRQIFDVRPLISF